MTQTVLLGDITTFLARGSAPKYTDKEGFYVINQKCIRDWRVSLEQARFTDASIKKVSEDRVLKANDILVNSTGQGTLGRVGQFYGADTPTTVDSHVTIVRADQERVDPIFLGYVLKGVEKKIEMLGEGSTGQTELSRSKLAALKLSLPDLGTQKKIANILGTIDEKIELNRRTNETLEQMGQALFRHYFIDNPEVEKWDKRELGEFFPIKTGKKDANFSTENGEYPFFTCAQTISKAPDFSFDAHALLLAGNGDFNLKLYRGKFEAYQRTYVLIPNDERLLGVLYFLMSIKLPEITGGSRGSVIKFITKGMIENYKFTLPNDEELAQLGEMFNQITINIEENIRQIQALTTLRDTLLPRLISGKVKV